MLPSLCVANSCEDDWTLASIAEAQAEEYMKQELYDDAAQKFITAADHYNDASNSCHGNNSIIAVDREQASMDKHFTAKWLGRPRD